MNITLEQRNAQKLFNLLNVANLNVQNRDIYCYLKNYVKTMINQYKLSAKDYEILSGHLNAFNNELKQSPWDIKQFDPNKYDKFLNDFYTKVNFNKIDIEFMFKCKDILEVSPVKNDLYRRRMEFFDKKLPKILPGNYNVLNKTQLHNNNINVNNNNNMNANNMPVNPFAGINNQGSSPYGNYNMGNQSPYQANASNNNERNILREQPPTKNKNPINNINNMNNNMNNNNNNNMNNNMNNNINNVNNMYNFENKKKIIPEDIKKKIINELNKISEDIIAGKIDSCRKHSVESIVLFKQIFPDQ